MKARIPLTSKQKKVLEQEIDRQVAESNARWDADYEAMMLWSLHLFAGYGKKRLLAFRKLFIQQAKALREHYEEDDVGFTARHQLKKLGIDIDEITKQESEG